MVVGKGFHDELKFIISGFDDRQLDRLYLDFRLQVELPDDRASLGGEADVRGIRHKYLTCRKADFHKML